MLQYFIDTFNYVYEREGERDSDSIERNQRHRETERETIYRERSERSERDQIERPERDYRERPSRPKSTGRKINLTVWLNAEIFTLAQILPTCRSLVL